MLFRSLILGVPTRFFRDWIVSRYLDKILEQVKSFKLSLNRIEFKIIEETKQNQELIKISELDKVSEIKDSILNYNRLNSSLSFDNFIQGESNDIAFSYSKKVCDHVSRYNPLYICGGVGLGKTHLMHEFNQDTTSSYTFMYSVIVCFFKTETISETDPITGVTTEHKIKQPTECKTFSLSHDVLNDYSFAPAFVSQFYAPFA